MTVGKDALDELLVAAADGLPTGFAVVLLEAAESSHSEECLSGGGVVAEPILLAKRSVEDVDLQGAEDSSRRSVWFVAGDGT